VGTDWKYIGVAQVPKVTVGGFLVGGWKAPPTLPPLLLSLSSVDMVEWSDKL
jgi:hypothetical protein